MEEIYKLVGKRIREERKKSDLSQEKLSELAGLSLAFIGQIERGQNRPSLATLQKIADALSIKVSELLSSIEPKSSNNCSFSKQLSLLIDRAAPQTKKDILKVINMLLKKAKK